MGIRIIVPDYKEFIDTEINELTLFVITGLEAVKKEREKKMREYNVQEYYKKLRTPAEYPNRTSEELKLHIKLMYPELVIDKWNEKQFDLLCRYFVGDETLLKEGYSLQKGVCLMGGVGVGKTTLMKIFNSNQFKSYIVRSCSKIAKDYSISGADVLSEYEQTFKALTPENFYGHTELGICFEDLGTEEEKKYFGNNSNVMTDIILSRYDSKLIGRQMTHLTTNLTGLEIEEKYGTRVRDRMKEIFNVISFDSSAPSRRK